MTLTDEPTWMVRRPQGGGRPYARLPLQLRVRQSMHPITPPSTPTTPRWTLSTAPPTSSTASPSAACASASRWRRSPWWALFTTPYCRWVELLGFVCFPCSRGAGARGGPGARGGRRVQPNSQGGSDFACVVLWCCFFFVLHACALAVWPAAPGLANALRRRTPCRCLTPPSSHPTLFQELYSAKKGGGAFCNGEPIRCSATAGAAGGLAGSALGPRATHPRDGGKRRPATTPHPS